MKETLALVIPCLSLFIYILLSSIEFGSSIFALFPKLIGGKHIVTDYLNPIWETTTVFLVFSLSSLLACFPGATARWGTDLFTITFTMIAVFGVRVVCVLFKQYSDITSRIINVMYTLTSFIVPTLFSLILLYFFTGSWTLYIKSPLYGWLALSVISCIIVMTCAFFRAYKKNKLLTWLTRISGTMFLLTSTLFLLAIANSLPYLFLYNSVKMWMALVLIVCIVGMLITESVRAYTWSLILLCAYIGTLFWGLFIAHLPYIVYPSATIASSITDSVSFAFIEWSFFGGIIILIPSLILLYRLFVFKK